MDYFYADGLDKKGNRLITSYKKKDQADRYRAGAKISEGRKFLEIFDGGAKLTAQDNGLLVRTLMTSSDVPVMEGPFVVYAKINGEWRETEFRYSNYAAANAAVKSALINLYGNCAVIEQETSKQEAPIPMRNIDEDAPF
jgi:hypothetical protein